ncbi:MAG: hypothetical protein CVU59_02250 [Deltaproteobacteria bacterium HGW-Deltaproteobacteria-17]|nr:MAG: hypothetical protein CVU59_02250 [Deltaproteobacteria bacterium HGW-Deltaproteobacteria-17]
MTAVDTIIDTVDGTQMMTLTNNPQQVTLAGGGVVTLSVVGNFLFNKLSASTADVTAPIFMPVNDLINRVPEAPAATGMTVTAGATATEVVLAMQSGGNTETYRATRTLDSMEIVFESTTSTEPFTSPTRYLLTRVGDTPAVFATAGDLDNVTILDTNGSNVTLATDTWTLLADGYYYQEGSDWTTTTLGVFSWHNLWSYAVDDLGTTVEGTVDVTRAGYLWDDGLGTLRFYFYGFDGTGTERAVTLYTTITSVVNVHSFTVSACIDSTSGSPDLACSGREFPLSFDIEAP